MTSIKFIQSDTEVDLSIYDEGLTQDHFGFLTCNNKVAFTYKDVDGERQEVNINLFAPIICDEVIYKFVHEHRINITMKKKYPGEWPQLRRPVKTGDTMAAPLTEASLNTL